MWPRIFSEGFCTWQRPTNNFPIEGFRATGFVCTVHILGSAYPTIELPESPFNETIFQGIKTSQVRETGELISIRFLEIAKPAGELEDTLTIPDLQLPNVITESRSLLTSENSNIAYILRFSRELRRERSNVFMECADETRGTKPDMKTEFLCSRDQNLRFDTLIRSVLISE